MKYQGSCHCKAVEFEFEGEEVNTALQCNCSICIRKNAIMSKQSFSRDEFAIIKGADNLAVYHWGDRDVNHYFCKTCGIYPFHNTTYDPDKYRVNLGCVSNIDSRNLNIIHFDGKNEL